MASELYTRVVDLALADPTATVADIARVLDCQRGTVVKYLSDARREGSYIPRRPQARAKGCGLGDLRPSEDVLQILHDAAERREKPLVQLVRQLLTHAARDGLIDAILDDGGADA